MSIYKALRTRAAINKVTKNASMIEVGIGVLTLASLVMSKPKKKAKKKNSKNWGHEGY